MNTQGSTWLLTCNKNELMGQQFIFWPINLIFLLECLAKASHYKLSRHNLIFVLEQMGQQSHKVFLLYLIFTAKPTFVFLSFHVDVGYICAKLRKIVGSYPNSKTKNTKGNRKMLGKHLEGKATCTRHNLLKLNNNVTLKYEST